MESLAFFCPVPLGVPSWWCAELPLTGSTTVVPADWSSNGPRFPVFDGGPPLLLSFLGPEKFLPDFGGPLLPRRFWRSTPGLWLEKLLFAISLFGGKAFSPVFVTACAFKSAFFFSSLSRLSLKSLLSEAVSHSSFA